MSCSRLRLASVTLDGIYHLHPYSWDGLFGWPGLRGENLAVLGRPGRYPTVDKEPEERVFTLGLLIRPHDTTGGVTLPGGACQHLEANQDEILGIVGGGGLKLLEWDMCDGTTRYLYVEFIDPMPINQALRNRELPLIGRAPYPQWQQSGTVTTSNITGTVNVNPGGNAWVDNTVLTFTVAGTLSNSLTGDSVQIDPGGGGTVTVDALTGRVTQGGVSSPGRLLAAGSHRLFRLIPGVNNPLTASAGTIGVAHRPHWW